MWTIAGVLAALGALTLVACGGSTATTPIGTVCPDYLVGTTQNPPSVIYPASGATGIPDGHFNIVTTEAFASMLQLTSSSAPEVTTGADVPAPLPLPSSTVTPAPGQTPQAYAVGSLQAATAYTIIATQYSSNGCPQSITTLGTFTTQ